MRRRGRWVSRLPGAGGRGQGLALLGGARDRRRGEVGRGERQDWGGDGGGGRCRAACVGGGDDDPQGGADVGGAEQVAASGLSGERDAGAARWVAALPLPARRRGFRPLAGACAQRLPFPRLSRDGGRRGVGRRGWEDERARRRVRARRPARVRRADADAQRRPHVVVVEGVRVLVGSGERRAARARPVAALPGIGVRRGCAAPGARARAQHLTLPRRPRDRRRRDVRRSSGRDHRRRRRRGRTRRTTRVRGGDQNTNRRTDIGASGAVRRSVRVVDALPGQSFVCRALPLVCKRGRRSAPRSRARTQHITFVRGARDLGRRQVCRGGSRDHRRGRRGVRVCRSACVGGGDEDAEEGADVGAYGCVGGVGGGGDGRPGAAVAGALPGVGVGGGRSAPAAGRCAQGLPFLGGAGDRGRGEVDRREREHGGAGGGGGRGRAARVGGGHDDPQGGADVGGAEQVAASSVSRGERDAGAARLGCSAPTAGSWSSASVHSPALAVSVCPSRASPGDGGRRGVRRRGREDEGGRRRRSRSSSRRRWWRSTRTRSVVPTSSASSGVRAPRLAPGERRAARARPVAALPRVGVRRGRAAPGARARAQHLTLPRRARDRRRRDVRRRSGRDHRQPSPPKAALADPPAFVAVTRTRTVEPTSAARQHDASRPSRSGMSAQLAPDALQRRHWLRERRGRAGPTCRAPRSASQPSRAVPDTVGRLVFAGGSGAERSATSWPTLQSCLTCACALRVYEPAAGRGLVGRQERPRSASCRRWLRPNGSSSPAGS